jgi:hypothetical protein
MIVSRQQSRARALERALVKSGLIAMCADSPAEALKLAGVLRFKVAVFLGPIDTEAAAAMRELHTRYGTRGIAMNGDPADEAAAAVFARRLASTTSPETLLQHIQELRTAG